MSEDQRSLPLFPLNTVLFPGMLLPLHIFEQRYRDMIGACLASDQTFGVSLIREGLEVGGPAEPFDIGTFATIVEANRLEDGRMNLIVLGVRRFRLIEILRRDPFLVGRVEAVRSAEEHVEPRVSQRVASRFRAFVDELRGDGQEQKPFQLSEDAETLSFQIAAVLGLSARERQRLLEQESTATRLKWIESLIRREHSALQLLGRTVPAGNAGPFSRN